MKKFIDDLMGKMTLEEKIGQLNLLTPGYATTGAIVNEDTDEKLKKGLVGGMFGTGPLENVISIQQKAVAGHRLGIPLIMGSDVIHGHKTIFPIPLALSCSWDMELIEKTARIAAIEAAADGLKWTFSPMVDISRDPRWGRIAEGSGEDPFLGSRIAQAMVKGYQGDDLAATDTVLACAKHFALYGAAEGGRDYNTVDMSAVRMHETYLPPFKAAVDAGCGTLMAAFNEVNGIPAHAHKELLDYVLRKQWGFGGFVVTDYTGINEMIAHGIGDLKEVSARSLDAGCDMDMVGEGFLKTLQDSLKDGKIKVEQIDAACRRILEAKYRLGLFDDPFKYLDPKRRQEKLFHPDHLKVAREAAAKSCVLLKNGGETLPLKKKGTIALIGPLADDRANMQGTWAVAAESDKSVTVLEGMKSVMPDANIIYAKGANITDDPETARKVNCFGEICKIDQRSADEMIVEAVKAAEQSDVIVACVGEAKEHSGESASRTELDIPENQRKLLKALKATGKKLVLVVMSGRPLTLNWENENADAIVHSWFAGTQAGNGIADVLSGAVNPAGKITATFPRNVGQIPLYYAAKNTGRPASPGRWDKFRGVYLDTPNEPLYPFGYGLSYTKFEYSPVKVSKTQLAGNETLKASVMLKNTGKYAGEEVVQLYITDPVASITRAVKDLKGFKKVMLQPGEAKEVVFDVTPEELKFFNDKLKYDWEPGEFVIHIGTNSSETQSAKVDWQKEAPRPKAGPAPEQK